MVKLQRSIVMPLAGHAALPNLSTDLLPLAGQANEM